MGKRNAFNIGLSLSSTLVWFLFMDLFFGTPSLIVLLHC